MHWWCGISALAGALRRRVWIDMKRYKIYPSFYICLVAPPGVVAKSTSIDVAMKLLRKVPGINFGPDSVTWPSLVEKFEECSEAFEFNDLWYPMSALTLEASELGSLLQPQDRSMIDLYITLWDGRDSYKKATKHSGSDNVEAPWINMLAGTTPNWIADNMPKATIGGGLTSRIIFVYAKHKEKFIAFVDEFVDPTDQEIAEKLLEDLQTISTTVCGPFKISAKAREWERDRYVHFWSVETADMNTALLEGYAARKQTHLFKTAMVCSAARGDSRIIEMEDLQLAAQMLDDLEGDMQKVFSSIGRTEDSLNAERFIDFVQKKGVVPYDEAYRMIHLAFPDFRNFEGILHGALNSGQILMTVTAKGVILSGKPQKPISPDTLV